MIEEILTTEYDRIMAVYKKLLRDIKMAEDNFVTTGAIGRLETVADLKVFVEVYQEKLNVIKRRFDYYDIKTSLPFPDHKGFINYG